MKRAFLFADPAAHSRSPAMHNAAFGHAGIDAHYEAVRVPPDLLATYIQTLRQPDVLGANLSLPHKEAVLPLLDTLSSAARAIGAVNTVVNRGGMLHGDNTDAPGFLAALASAGDHRQGGAVVLGAGGAARAAVWALRSQGRGVYVVNRTHEKAVELTRELGGTACALEAVPWPSIQLIVNASSAGLSDAAQSPLPGFEFSVLPSSALVYDMVYKPAETRLMYDARAAGLRAENGLEMLAQQARLAFTAWTGVEVPIRVFLDALAVVG
ncbi:shikimate dehydrogenase [Deinococcus ruber]|uniref:Shikimate dehydrogenase (NADP(+)) n=1 Tax=Deinococcus ruber TaxID=1848197 RepID=A0A918CKC7_9DEIO|nr:shikimate dehydrogenase [Deinococcus ruber]GGR29973.1 shikimate dehydrogenase (NADP(+)) [Deinococcus ruber]